MSYINIDKALESIDLIAKNDGEKFDKDSARYAIQTTEISDVVPVVRCCNCIHLIATINKTYYCDFHSTNWDKFYVRPDDYCSYGERKDNK